MEQQSSSEYMQKMMKQMVEATGVPSCFICGARIVGAHIDYMDKDRVPRKICIRCTYQALDYFINARAERSKGDKTC